MLEKIFGKKNSMQRRLIIEFIIALILVVVLSNCEKNYSFIKWNN